MIKTYRVMLLQNNRQSTRFFQMAGAARYAYNWALARQKENHAAGGKFINSNSLSREFTSFRKQEGMEWLLTIPSNLTAIAIKDACEAFIRFFEGQSKFPRFKSKKRSKVAFANRNNKIKITATHVKLEKLALSTKRNKQLLNFVRLAERNRIPKGIVYSNPRVSFDGLNWWLTLGVESEVNYHSKTEGIGIDLGLKNFAVLSDGVVYKNINKDCESSQGRNIIRLEKRLSRLQRQVSRKYEMNKDGQCFVKTKNIVKLENQILKIHQRLHNIRLYYLHDITSSIVGREPSYVVIEDLNVSGMMKNKHLAKSIQQQKFYEFRRILEYKCKLNEITWIVADRFFPSSRMCLECGEIKKDLRLKDRLFKCSHCGHVMDRDEQAALNLKLYGERIIESNLLFSTFKQ